MPTNVSEFDSEARRQQGRDSRRPSPRPAICDNPNCEQPDHFGGTRWAGPTCRHRRYYDGSQWTSSPRSNLRQQGHHAFRKTRLRQHLKIEQGESLARSSTGDGAARSALEDSSPHSRTKPTDGLGRGEKSSRPVAGTSDRSRGFSPDIQGRGNHVNKRRASNLTTDKGPSSLAPATRSRTYEPS